MKIICNENIYEFEKDKEYTIEEISRYIVGNIQVFVQNYVYERISVDVNIINSFLSKFRLENN